jgi:hypothetical protein
LHSGISLLVLLSATTLFAQTHPAHGSSLLAPQTTLPITFTKSISADHSRPGDTVIAKTTQPIKLANGRKVGAGALVTGHVISANAFGFDKTPYAKQKASTLEVQFDALVVHGEKLPLRVYVRAMAGPFTSWDAQKPQASDMDPLGTLTQVGGDQLTPSQKEILNRDGDIVGYNKHGGAFAHLIANSGRGAQCDGTDTEQPVFIFSASACGLYGFANLSSTSLGSESDPSHLSFSSTHGSPKIWRSSTALLEVLPDSNVASIQ